MHDAAGFGGGIGAGADEAEIQRAIEESLRQGGGGAAYGGADDDLRRILEKSKQEYWKAYFHIVGEMISEWISKLKMALLN